ncbi:transposase [Cupriavidus sp. UYMMa02A]|uniref:Tn3 family transposase post-transcriptional regulator TnpC n=1 Tax=Cupriavidus pinatubonensis TaxID=248026 RepID=UPI00086BE843|nr:Tn3 family transposase post-transcriptional regulator TnpC [Cupriavidus pinatubonensis]ODV43103.1 transposase [Cupriavidus sp. UYMMa02A]TPQ25008.1 transposase [Cupriavidus pinatubonensis]
MPNTQTPYGPVDTEALRCLQDSFDTREILRIVDLVDTLRTRLCEPEGIRDDLLQLHGMAHTVLNGASLVLRATNPTLVEQAETIVEELEDLIRVLQHAVHVLHPLELLRPSGDT